MTGDEAQILALRALGWLAGQDELWQGFLGESGLAAAEVPALAGEAGFLAAVLDYLTRHDAWITAFCDAEGLAYTQPMAAHRALPGGSDPHWT